MSVNKFDENKAASLVTSLTGNVQLRWLYGGRPC